MGFGFKTRPTERSTLLTLDQQISHLPRGPRSSLMKRSKATPSSESSEEIGEIFAPIWTSSFPRLLWAFSFPRLLARESRVWNPGFAKFEFRVSSKKCFSLWLPVLISKLLSTATCLWALGSEHRPCTTAATKDLEAMKSTPGKSFEGRLMAGVLGAKAFLKWELNPLQPQPKFPSGTTMKPF